MISGNKGRPAGPVWHYGDSSVMEYFLRVVGVNVNATNAFDGRTMLHRAASSDDAVTVEILIKYGADVNLKDERGQTSLQFAKAYGATKAVKILTAHHADSAASPTAETKKKHQKTNKTNNARQIGERSGKKAMQRRAKKKY